MLLNSLAFEAKLLFVVNGAFQKIGKKFFRVFLSMNFVKECLNKVVLMMLYTRFRAIWGSCGFRFIETKNPYEVGLEEAVQPDNPRRPEVMRFRDMERHMKVRAVGEKNSANISFLEIPPGRYASGRLKRKNATFREKKVAS